MCPCHKSLDFVGNILALLLGGGLSAFRVLVVAEVIKFARLHRTSALALEDVHLNSALVSFRVSDRIEAGIIFVVDTGSALGHCVRENAVDKLQDLIVTSKVVVEIDGCNTLSIFAVQCVFLLSCKEDFRV